MTSIARGERGPRVLAIGGLEPSGRMGLLADLATARACGCAPEGVATMLTTQGRRFRAEMVSARMLAMQLDALAERGAPAAVKLGGVMDRAQLEVIRARLLRWAVPVVVDPVVRTSRGERLSRLVRDDYLALAHPFVMITPNVPELGWLLGRRRPPSAIEEAEAWGGVLLDRGFGAVIVKGGHLEGAAVDVVISHARAARISGPRRSRDPQRHRGTGCRFGTALACGLAKADDLPSAARTAKRYVDRWLRE